MGSACFFNNFKLTECCSNKSMVTNISKSDRVLTKDIPQNDDNKEVKLNIKNDSSKFNSILNYFNTEEKEILAEFYKQRDKEKIMTRNKENSNYELTVKRLLEQQTLKKVGPKRRQTIRNEGDKILKIVKQIIQENKEEAMRTMNTKDKESEEITLRNTSPHKKGRYSQNIDKNMLMNNRIKKNHIKAIKEES